MTLSCQHCLEISLSVLFSASHPLTIPAPQYAIGFSGLNLQARLNSLMASFLVAAWNPSRTALSERRFLEEGGYITRCRAIPCLATSSSLKRSWHSVMVTLLAICSGLELESLAQLQVCVNIANSQTITAKSCELRILNIANLFCSILCHHDFHCFFNCYPLVVLLSPSFLHLIYLVHSALRSRGAGLTRGKELLMYRKDEPDVVRSPYIRAFSLYA